MLQILTKVACGNLHGIPQKIPKLTSEIFFLIEVAIPVLLVIMGTLDLFKAITSNKEDEMTKARGMFFKRLITGAIVFFLFIIVKFTVSLLDNRENTESIIECVNCFINNDACTPEKDETTEKTETTNQGSTSKYLDRLKKLQEKELQRQLQKAEQEKRRKEQESLNKLSSDKIGSFTKYANGLNYFLYVPEGAKKGMPLVIFLHGKGEDGKIEQVKKLAPVTSVVNGLVQGSEQFIFLAPAAPTGKLWLESGKTTWDSLNALIDTISNEYSIDINRLYLTGFSAGGCAVWKLVENFPTKYRAAVPVSCSGDIRTASNFKHTPIYAIAGANEPGYVDGMQKSVKKINDAGGNAKFKTIPNAGHVQTQSSYSTKELYKWLLSQ